MGEFISEDWGLEAMIRGGDDNSAAMSCSFDPLLLNPQNYNTNDDFGFDFVHLFEANNITLSNEFDQLYKPFVPVFDDSLDSFTEEMKIIKPELEMKKQKSSKSSSSSTVHAVKYKKRKNQHKRVVLLPEGHPSDTWAWRKYGQKPIKGSPYPRSYYKCSSSKGCLARKQVEQSSTDPGMFKISYSAEHNHSQPTRRSSLAGTNRHKFTVQKTSSSSTDDSSVVGTPKDSGTTNIIEDVILEQHIKNEENINLFIDGKIGSQNECVFFDQDTLLLNDDFFVGLEDLDGLISESAFYNLL